MEEIEKQIELLREQINQYNYEYYVLDAPTIEDYVFDTKLKQLENLEKTYPQYYSEYSPTNRVGGTINKQFKQITHSVPMLSLANTYSKQEIIDFIQRAQNTLGREDLQWVCELKYDGLAVSLTYKEGKLFCATTRGNGLIGDEVTDNVRCINSVPLVLIGKNYPDILEVRGEVLMPHKNFEKLNAQRLSLDLEPFANCRNAASGSLKLQDSKEVAKRGLDCYLYFVVGDNVNLPTHLQRIEQIKQWGLKTEKHYCLCNTIDQIMQFIDYWDKKRFSLSYDIDGIVIKLNTIKDWVVLGSSAKSPKWATAYKFKAQRAKAKLLSVEYQVGRTGIITPVANFQSVELGGTKVSRATLINSNNMDKLNLCQNDTLFIEKGGEIIPKIVDVEHENTPFDKTKRIIFPTLCPQCHTPLVKDENLLGWYCPNDRNCLPQKLGHLEHFVSKGAMNIEALGEKRLRYLFFNKKISDFVSLYQLQKGDLIGVYNIPNEGTLSIQDKGATNIISSINLSKKIPFWRVLFALGIRYVGAISAKNLATNFQNIDNLLSSSIETIASIKDIGQTIAKSVFDYMHKQENIDQINALRQLGLQFEVDLQTQTSKQSNIASNFLNDKTFVVSGVFDNYSRQEIKDEIEKYGGKNVSSLSKNTSFLICGQKMGEQKKQKALDLNIKMITEQDFINMINSKTMTE